MTVTTQDRPSKRSAGAKPHAPVLVSGVKLALHFGVIRQRIDQLAAQGIFERRSDGLFDQDACRLKYLDHLRTEHRRSPRNEAHTLHDEAKTQLLRIRIEEKQRTLVRRDQHEAMLDKLAGLMLTHLGSWPARVAGRDLVLRRRAEALLREIRTEIAEACTILADEAGEPPLDQQDALI